jgi:hypothetical protein
MNVVRNVVTRLFSCDQEKQLRTEPENYQNEDFLLIHQMLGGKGKGVPVL